MHQTRPPPFRKSTTHLELSARQDANVGRNAVARLHKDNVADHELASINGFARPVAHHNAVRREHITERICSLLGLALLDDTDRDVDDNDEQDERALGDVMLRKRNAAGRNEDPNEGRVNLFPDLYKEGRALRGRERVRAIFSEPLLSLGSRQTTLNVLGIRLSLALLYCMGVPRKARRRRGDRS